MAPGSYELAIITANITVDATVESFNQTSFLDVLYHIFPEIPLGAITISMAGGSVTIGVQIIVPTSDLQVVETIISALSSPNATGDLTAALGMPVLSVGMPSLRTVIVEPPDFFSTLHRLSRDEARHYARLLSLFALFAFVATTALAGLATALPLLFALQRSVIIAMRPGVPAHPVVAVVANEMQWVLGRRPGLELFSGSSGNRNEIVNDDDHSSGDFDATDVSSGVAAVVLYDDKGTSAALLATFIDFAVSFCAVMSIHLALLYVWSRQIKKRERKDAAQSKPTSASKPKRGDRVAPKAATTLSIRTQPPSPPPSPSGPGSQKTKKPSKASVYDKILDSYVYIILEDFWYDSKAVLARLWGAVLRAFLTKRMMKAYISGLTMPPPKGFVPLPNLLAWPNAETIVIVSFACGLANTACVVIAHRQSAGGTKALGVLILLGLVMYLSVVYKRIKSFRRRFGEQFWNSSNASYKKKRFAIKNVRDPLTRFLTKLGFFPPADRFRGVYEASTVHLREPDRTKRLLKGPFGMSTTLDEAGTNAGDAFASLSIVWLANSANGKSIYYQLIRVTAHIIIGVAAGFAQVGATPGLARTGSVLIALIQFALCLYYLRGGGPSDRLEGIFAALESLLCGTAVAVQDAALSDSDGEMLGAAGRLLLMSTLMPLFMVAYDVAMLPSLVLVFGKRVVDPSRIAPTRRTGQWNVGGQPSRPNYMTSREVAAHKADAQQKQLLKRKVTLDSFSKLKLSLPGVVSERRAEEYEEQARAATVMQASWRSRAERKQVAQLRITAQERDEQLQAATRLQSVWRGRSDRHPDVLNVALIEKNIRCLQRAWRKSHPPKIPETVAPSEAQSPPSSGPAASPIQAEVAIVIEPRAGPTDEVTHEPPSRKSSPAAFHRVKTASLAFASRPLSSRALSPDEIPVPPKRKASLPPWVAARTNKEVALLVARMNTATEASDHNSEASEASATCNEQASPSSPVLAAARAAPALPPPRRALPLPPPEAPELLSFDHIFAVHLAEDEYVYAPPQKEDHELRSLNIQDGADLMKNLDELGVPR